MIRAGSLWGFRPAIWSTPEPLSFDAPTWTRFLDSADSVVTVEDRAEIICTAIRRAQTELKLSNVDLEDVTVIGDAPQDVRAAKKVGVRAIAVTTGNLFNGTADGGEPILRVTESLKSGGFYVSDRGINRCGLSGITSACTRRDDSRGFTRRSRARVKLAVILLARLVRYHRLCTLR